MEPHELANYIAEVLGETKEVPLQEIAEVVEFFGPEFAEALLAEALEVEANGGMMTVNGKRRRTVGGVFFYLAHQRATTATQKAIFPDPSEGVPETAMPPIFIWEQRRELLLDLLQEKGEGNSVKITVTGRPGRVEYRRDLVITTIAHTPNPKKPMSLPKGVPSIPITTTNYVCYIAQKQWKKVVDAIAVVDDILIIEGQCVFDPELEAIAVYATTITTRALQRKNSEKIKAAQAAEQAAHEQPAEGEIAAEAGDSEEAQPQAPARPATPRPPARAAVRPIPTQPDARETPPPPEAVRKLSDLRRAEQIARDTLDELKTLPPEEQTDLPRALQVLQKIKAEIQALKQQYPRLS